MLGYAAFVARQLNGLPQKSRLTKAQMQISRGVHNRQMLSLPVRGRERPIECACWSVNHTLMQACVPTDAVCHSEQSI